MGMLLLVIAVGLAAGPVRAENRESSFTLSPFAGGQGFPFGGDTHYDGDFNWGVRAGYNFTPRFGLEFVFSENETVHDPEVAFCTIHQYGIDALYFFQPEKNLVPFVAAGFGVFDVNFDGTFDYGAPPGYAPLSDETNPYFNYGAGVEYALTRWVAVRADFRHAIMLDSGDHSFQGVLGFRFQF
jgi:OOP family OmpA-OmpF porin